MKRIICLLGFCFYTGLAMAGQHSGVGINPPAPPPDGAGERIWDILFGGETGPEQPKDDGNKDDQSKK